MTETGQDFTRYRGEDWTIPVTIEGSGSITGWTFVATFRKSLRESDASDPLLEIGSGAGIEITDAAAREIEISVTDDQTLLFDDGIKKRRYPWDLKRTNVGSEAILLTGTATILNPGSR